MSHHLKTLFQSLGWLRMTGDDLFIRPHIATLLRKIPVRYHPSDVYILLARDQIRQTQVVQRGPSVRRRVSLLDNRGRETHPRSMH
jgi:hypothetical protein